MKEHTSEKLITLSEPAKRLELILFLEELSDIQYQDRLWINHEDYPNTSGINEVYHFFFDDTDLALNTPTLVGSILYNNHELEVVSQLIIELDKMLNTLGDVDSQAFMSDHNWPVIMEKSKIALDTLKVAKQFQI